jgi:hypothetical protein
MAKLSASNAAAQMGWNYLADAPSGFSGEWSIIPGIRSSGRVTHLMQGPLGRWQATAFVSTFVLYTGQVNVPVSRTVFALDTPVWPTTNIMPRSWMARLLWPLMRRKSGLILENTRFNSTFKVRSDDEDFAITLLSPEVQKYLLTKSTVRWYMGYGRLCLICPGTMQPENVVASAERLERMMALIPPEMEAWDSLSPEVD